MKIKQVICAAMTDLIDADQMVSTGMDKEAIEKITLMAKTILCEVFENGKPEREE